MLLTRAGLAKLLFSKLRPRMGVANVLSLILAFSAILVQAMPVPTHFTTPSTALSGAGFATNEGEMRSTAAPISTVIIHDLPVLLSSLPNGANGNTAAYLRYGASTPIKPSLDLLARENTQPMVLERRFNFGSKIKSAFHHVVHAVSHAVHTVGHAVKHAGHFVMHHKVIIAKVGLKAAATLGEVAGKAAPFIPGMGSVAGKLLVQGSKKLNSASDAIHAHVGGKLGAAMRGMDMAQRITSKVP